MKTLAARAQSRHRSVALALTTGEVLRPGWLIKEAARIYPSVIADIKKVLLTFTE